MIEHSANQGWLTSAVADGPAMGNEGAWLKRRSNTKLLACWRTGPDGLLLVSLFTLLC